MSRFRRTYGQGVQLITDTIGGNSIAYDYSVATYADLPISPPDEIVVQVENAGGDVQLGFYVYDSVTLKWYLIHGFIATIGLTPASTTLYSAGGIDVEIAFNSQLSVVPEGRALICDDSVAPTWLEQTPPVSVAEYTDLPLVPPQNYKLLCTNDSLLGLGPLQGVYLQHDTNNNWFVIQALVNDETELPNSSTVYTDGTYLISLNGGTIAYNAGRAWVYSGVAWAEFYPGDATDWGTFANQGAFPTQFLRDTDKAYSTADVATFIYDLGTTTWLYYRLDWDGTTPGQTYADLPLTDIESGAIAIVGTDCYQWSGAAWVKFGSAQVSVDTFSQLPTSADEEVSAFVSSMTGYSCFVTYNAGSWKVYYVNLTTFEDRPLGTVYNSGGIVVEVANGANMTWFGKDLSGFQYNATIGEWLPSAVANWTSPSLEIYIAGTENSATLTANGWTVATAGTGALTTDGTKVSISSSTTGSSASVTRTFTSTKLYTHGRFQVTNFASTNFSFYHRTGARDVRFERRYSLVTAAYFVVFNGGSIPNNITYSQQGLGTEAWVHYISGGGLIGPTQWYVNGMLVTGIGVDFFSATGTGNYAITHSNDANTLGNMTIRDLKVVKGT